MITGHAISSVNKMNLEETIKATQFLSDTVSKAMLFKFGEEFSDQARIISTIDKWFDVMNSRLKYDLKKRKMWIRKVIKTFIYLIINLFFLI